VRLGARYTCDLVHVRAASEGEPAGLSAPGAFRLGQAEGTSDYRVSTMHLAWEPSTGANRYRVIVAEEAGFASPLLDRTVAAPMVVVRELEAGKTYHWKVEAGGWGGTRWNESGTGTFTAPPRKTLPGVTFVSDLEWRTATAGADNPVRRDVNYYGKGIRIAGQACPKGVWTHAFNDTTPADVVLDLAGHGYGTFACVAGPEDAAYGGSVQFQVLVDGAVKAESPVLRAGATHLFRVDVKGAQTLTLRVLNGGDGYACDHAAWGMARLIAEGETDPLADRP